MKLYESINKNRREYFATATTAEKFKYLVDYYGFRTIVALVILTISTILIVQACTAPESVLSGTFINISLYARENAVAELENEFMKEQKIDSSKFTADFGSNLTISESDPEMTSASYQVLAAQASGKTLDFIVSSPDFVITYAYEKLFVDLTDVLTPEQIEMYKPYFLYVDGEVIKANERIEQSSDEMFDRTYPDCRKPEEMKDPIPVLIDLSSCKKIKTLYNAKKIDLCFGIVETGPNLENSLKFLDFIMKEK